MLNSSTSEYDIDEIRASLGKAHILQEGFQISDGPVYLVLKCKMIPPPKSKSAIL
jgi:hypothetical protein